METNTSQFYLHISFNKIECVVNIYHTEGRINASIKGECYKLDQTVEYFSDMNAMEVSN